MKGKNKLELFFLSFFLLVRGMENTTHRREEDNVTSEIERNDAATSQKRAGCPQKLSQESNFLYSL